MGNRHLFPATTSSFLFIQSCPVSSIHANPSLHPGRNQTPQHRCSDRWDGGWMHGEWGVCSNGRPALDSQQPEGCETILCGSWPKVPFDSNPTKTARTIPAVPSSNARVVHETLSGSPIPSILVPTIVYRGGNARPLVRTLLYRSPQRILGADPLP